MEESAKFIRRPIVVFVLLICVILYYLIPSGNIANSEEEEEESSSMSRRAREIQEKRSKEEAIQKDYERGVNPNDPTEYNYGTKRYKLFEKKQLTFKKAQAFCKKMDGQLAKTEKIEEMQRLQMLLMKAKTISDEMWIGVDKKEWKKHAWRDRDHPPGMNPAAFGDMSAMMMGGGKQEMCPALSSSTRSLVPVMCMKQLPFVCEFERSSKPKSITDLGGKAKAAKTKKGVKEKVKKKSTKKKIPGRDEM